MNTKRILLTGGRAPSTLDLARQLNAQGFCVHVAESFPYCLAKVSTAVQKFHITRNPKQETAGFIQDLIQIIKSEQIDLLIPTCEEIFYIALHQDKIKKYGEVFIDSSDKLLSLHNKYEFIKLAESFGLTVPQTKLITGLKEWEEQTSTLTKKYIAKPVFSRFSNEVRFLPEDTRKEIEINQQKQWVLQEFIEGTHYCSYSVVKNGKIVAHTVYKSEFRAGNGASIHFQHVPYYKINAWVKKFVEQTDFYGQIAFDFIENRNGEVFAIECNPRLTSGIHLFRQFNMSSIFLNEEEIHLEPSVDTSVSLKAALALFARQNIQQNGWKRFSEALKLSKDVVWDHHDMKPFLYQFRSYFEIWKISKKLNISLLEATTFDISWDGEHQ